ncbi:MAG TPA: DciA family protein [Xanthobacteraceae bacterium]
MNKPASSSPRPLADILRKTLGEAFAKQGFASVELVTRWGEIVGAEIAAHSQPEKIQWPRTPQARDAREPGTLLLRVEGPAAVEIQHLSGVIAERVNQFFGWQAVGSVRLRQAPLARPVTRDPLPAPDPAATARIAAALPEIRDEKLRDALARLGAAMGSDLGEDT